MITELTYNDLETIKVEYLVLCLEQIIKLVVATTLYRR